MPRKKKRSQDRPKEQYSHIAVRVDRYEVRSESSINHHESEPQLAIDDPDEEPLYQYLTHLEVFGTIVEPQDQAGDGFELTVYGEDSPSSRIFARLKDVHLRDENRSPRYRTYRGQDYPVYWTPKGVGTVGKARGERRWTGAIFVAPHFVTDWLILLVQGRKLFLAIHECKMERQRWMRSIALQTSDPREE